MKGPKGLKRILISMVWREGLEPDSDTSNAIASVSFTLTTCLTREKVTEVISHLLVLGSW